MSADGGERPDQISRRALLGRVGAAGAFVALTDALPASETAEAQTRRTPVREPLEALTPAEADTLEAITARLIPTDAAGPGAMDARAMHYIDRAIAGALASYRDTYRAGLAAVDAYAQAAKGAPFARLTAADQDAVLTDLERNTAKGFDNSAAFFNVVLTHTLQGTFSDPFYGGNRNFAGWDLIGYPGVRLAVTAEQQNLDATAAPTHMSAYDYTMFSGRKPAHGH
jgi:gluconate 2-dehydrogenase gamma chain